MRRVKVPLTKEAGTEDLPLPQYQTTGSSGMDLVCALKKPLVLSPGETAFVSTGISVSIPEGYEAQIRPRSGLALKYGITLLNSPGTIDSDYRGVISLIVINLGKADFVINRGMRLAQMVLQSVVKADWEVVPDLDETARSVQGFGHTGHRVNHDE